MIVILLLLVKECGSFYFSGRGGVNRLLDLNGVGKGEEKIEVSHFSVEIYLSFLSGNGKLRHHFFLRYKFRFILFSWFFLVSSLLMYRDIHTMIIY